MLHLHCELSPSLARLLLLPPPPCRFTWFMNIPKGMTNSMQVTKQRKICVEKNYTHFSGRGGIRTPALQNKEFLETGALAVAATMFDSSLGNFT